MTRNGLSVAIVRDPADTLAASPPVAWAGAELAAVLTRRGIQVGHYDSLEAAPNDSLVVVASDVDAPIVRAAWERSAERPVETGDQHASAVARPLSRAAEGLALLPWSAAGRDVTLAAGADARGLVYALLELADRVATATAEPLAGLRLQRPTWQQPANPIRGVARLFSSQVEDLGWFRDRAFWERYLSMLATQRFNRVHLAFGMGHDFLRNVVDAYLLFAYPFLVDVAGYDVRVPGLSDAEREQNLDALRFASEAAAARGLHFQLGVWTQAYAWVDSPYANYVIHGLHTDNHAAYCRDAIRTVLQACPAIAGVTFRVHGESGVAEGNYDFWREVFRGVVECGRTVELDMHPKGLAPEMLRVGLETGLPVRLSPKYTAEHMGLPGHQLAIRELERQPPPDDEERDAFRENLMNQSGAALRYTRYGNADFLRLDRQYGVFYRIWPGTQRFLLWGDPALAAGYGRYGSFCGSLGVEWCEPLSFKGRRGSGQAGGRDGYAEAALREDGGTDWEKFAISYRLFGRLLYDPAEDADVWQRAVAHDFGAAAARPVEAALANASRVLPLVTSAYHPSAANNRYWPEVYTNLPITSANQPHPYRDTRSPRRFGAASALDPGLFASIDEFVDETLRGQPSGRLSPLNVAGRLDRLASAAERALAAAEPLTDNQSPRFRRLAADVNIQAGLGRFFAAKLRAGVAYALYTATAERGRLRQALDEYAQARAAWCEVIRHGRAYRADLTVGGEAWLRGHWSDRLAAIDADRAVMQAEWDVAAGPRDAHPGPGRLADLEPPPPPATCDHRPPAVFRPGQPLPLVIDVRLASAERLDGVDLHYRHVNQAETYEVVRMRADQADCFEATIPGAYTDTAYPLQYFFVLRTGSLGWRYPDLAADLANQPYFVVGTLERGEVAA